MGFGHDHGRSGDQGPDQRQIVSVKYRRPLLWAILATGLVLIVEIVTAFATGSLALVSEAAHMATDLTGLILAYVAITIAATSRSTPRRTFGLHRLETLAALANALLLFGFAAYVVIEAINRLLTSEPAPPPTPMMVVAVLALVVNTVIFAVLRRGAAENLAIRAAALEVFADAFGAVAVLVAGVLIALTGRGWVDPVVALALAVFIVPRTWRLARQTLRVLVQAAPEHVDVALLERDLAALPQVVDVHDLHVWTLASGMDVASAHLSVDPATDMHPVLDAARDLLEVSYGIQHATIQVEPTDHVTCRSVSW